MAAARLLVVNAASGIEAAIVASLLVMALDALWTMASRRALPRLYLLGRERVDRLVRPRLSITRLFVFIICGQRPSPTSRWAPPSLRRIGERPMIRRSPSSWRAIFRCDRGSAALLPAVHARLGVVFLRQGGRSTSGRCGRLPLTAASLRCVAGREPQPRAMIALSVTQGRRIFFLLPQPWPPAARRHDRTGCSG